MKFRIILPVIFTLFLLSGEVFGQQSAIGFCENGNVPVLVGGLTSTTKVQGSYPSCTVTVYNAGTVVLSTIYTSQTLGTPLANPFTAQSNGYWQFFTAGGRYDIVLSKTGMTTRTISGYLLGDVTLLWTRTAPFIYPTTATDSILVGSTSSPISVNRSFVTKDGKYIAANSTEASYLEIYKNAGTSYVINSAANSATIRDIYLQTGGTTLLATGYDFSQIFIGQNFTSSTGVTGSLVVSSQLDVATAATNASILSLVGSSGGAASIISQRAGSGTFLPLRVVTSAVERMRWNTDGGIRYSGIATASAPAGSAGNGVMYFNSTTNTFKCSENNAAFVNCISSSSTSPWTGSGTYIYPTTITDNVVLGATSSIFANSGGLTVVGANIGLAVSNGAAAGSQVLFSYIDTANSRAVIQSDGISGLTNGYAIHLRTTSGIGNPLTKMIVGNSNAISQIYGGGTTTVAEPTDWVGGGFISENYFMAYDGSATNASYVSLGLETGGTVAVLRSDRSAAGGTYRPMAFTTSNSEAVRIQTTGHVSIGTAADNGYTLDVQGSVNVATTTRLNTLTYTWPASQTAGYVLSTNGAGVLTWTAAGTGGTTPGWTYSSPSIYASVSTDKALVGITTTDSTTSSSIYATGAIGGISAATNAATLTLQATNAVAYTAITSGRTGAGTYRPMAIFTNNSEKVRLQLDGTLSIGTTTDSAYILDVVGAGRVTEGFAAGSSAAEALGVASGMTSVSSGYYYSGSTLGGSVNASAAGVSLCSAFGPCSSYANVQASVVSLYGSQGTPSEGSPNVKIISADPSTVVMSFLYNASSAAGFMAADANEIDVCSDSGPCTAGLGVRNNGAYAQLVGTNTGLKAAGTYTLWTGNAANGVCVRVGSALRLLTVSGGAFVDGGACPF